MILRKRFNRKGSSINKDHFLKDRSKKFKNDYLKIILHKILNKKI